jgi:hypothetical protein
VQAVYALVASGGNQSRDQGSLDPLLFIPAINEGVLAGYGRTTAHVSYQHPKSHCYGVEQPWINVVLCLSLEGVTVSLAKRV